VSFERVPHRAATRPQGIIHSNVGGLGWGGGWGGGAFFFLGFWGWFFVGFFVGGCLCFVCFGGEKGGGGKGLGGTKEKVLILWPSAHQAGGLQSAGNSYVVHVAVFLTKGAERTRSVRAQQKPRLRVHLKTEDMARTNGASKDEK